MQTEVRGGKPVTTTTHNKQWNDVDDDKSNKNCKRNMLWEVRYLYSMIGWLEASCQTNIKKRD